MGKLNLHEFGALVKQIFKIKGLSKLLPYSYSCFQSAASLWLTQILRYAIQQNKSNFLFS